MLRGFFLWLEQGAYRAICLGCQRAVENLSGGDRESRRTMFSRLVALLLAVESRS